MYYGNLFCLGALSIFLPSLLAQKLSILYPKEGAVLKPGSKIDIKLHQDSYASVSTQVAWTLGLKASTSGKNIYLGNVGYEGAGATHDEDPTQKTYTWTVTLPSADKFGKGLGQDYHLILSQYYLAGATNTPTTSKSEAAVKIEKAWDKAL